MPKANILDKSEPSHLSSILNLLRRRLFDAIQRPQKDIKEKVVGFCGAWFRCNLRLKEGWWLISRELWRGTVCIVYISARLTYSNIIAKPSAWAKLSCQVPSFGSKSTLHNFLAHASRSKLQTVNCVRMIGLIVRYFLGSRLEVSQQLALVRNLSWFVQNCQRSIHSTAWPLQHRAQKNSSIGRYRTGVRLLAVRRLHWAIPSFPARQVPFGSLSLGWHLLIVCRYLKAIDVIDAQFWCEFSRNCFSSAFPSKLLGALSRQRAQIFFGVSVKRVKLQKIL